jgi:biopolymer transport protein ExbD
MHRSGRLRRRRGIALTSLIDVIFILLLFFLLSSTFTRFGEISLATSPIGAGPGTAQTPPIFLQLSSDMLTLNGSRQGLATILPALQDIAPTKAAPRASLCLSAMTFRPKGWSIF